MITFFDTNVNYRHFFAAGVLLGVGVIERRICGNENMCKAEHTLGCLIPSCLYCEINSSAHGRCLPACADLRTSSAELSNDMLTCT